MSDRIEAREFLIDHVWLALPTMIKVPATETSKAIARFFGADTEVTTYLPRYPLFDALGRALRRHPDFTLKGMPDIATPTESDYKPAPALDWP